MHHIPVKSSTIESVGYDRSQCVMQIKFKGYGGKPGSTYQYTHATPDVVTDLLFAESVGSHFAKNVKGSSAFPCTKLEAEVAQ